MYEDLKESFYQAFQRKAERVFSAPGRTELSGNHTDHQLGHVLAAAVDRDITAAVAMREDGIVRVVSEGFAPCEVDISDLSIREEEKGTTAALIRGVLFRCQESGVSLNGFDAYLVSNVLPGGGLSSSAAFEVLIGTIVNALGEGGLSPLRIAQIGQYAENVYFGKPCGLMDQAASSIGGIITIDFQDRENPQVERVDFDFSSCGHALCIVDSGASHEGLTNAYASIPEELHRVCDFFGKEALREVDEDAFYREIDNVRKKSGDRAVLRAIHIFEENKRVLRQIDALRRKDFTAFLTLATASGRSSYMYLQNAILEGASDQQAFAFTYALTEHLLQGRGAVRVQGGGFAGAIQAFVPLDMLEEFRLRVEEALGKGRLTVLRIRNEGGIECR
ncbi:MAG: galactokinase [Lachnospiraceae bacterium]|nr:galactokinase [Lachnospiraceae bacterium]